jgi:hypothetical protein
MVKLFSVAEMQSVEREANSIGLSYKEMMEKELQLILSLRL